MRAHHLALLAVSLGLAACTVDNSSLKPKTEAQCVEQLGADGKACGNRCVLRTDPATGCGQPGCNACPAPAGMEAVCDSSFQCATRAGCGAGQAYCGGPSDTTCEDLQTDPLHCGACGHSCGGAGCASGFCAPEAIAPAGTSPRSLAGAPDHSVYGNPDHLYWIADTAGATVLVHDGSFVTTLASWHDHVMADRNGAVVWSDAAGRSIVAWDPYNAETLVLFTPTSAIRAMSMEEDYTFFAEVGAAAPETSMTLLSMSRTIGSLWSWPIAGGSPILSVANLIDPGYGVSVLVATDAGVLRWVDYSMTQEDVVVSGIQPAVKLAVYRDTSGVETTWTAFWLDARGNLYSRFLPDGPVRQHTTLTTAATGALELVGDTQGVYWADETHGYVAEWRPGHDDVVYLYRSLANPPRTVAANTSPSRVCWSDAAGAIRCAPK